MHDSLNYPYKYGYVAPQVLIPLEIWSGDCQISEVLIPECITPSSPSYYMTLKAERFPLNGIFKATLELRNQPHGRV